MLQFFMLETVNDKVTNDGDDMLPSYDFRGGVRGKYAARFAEATKITVELAPDVAAAFPDAEAVNEVRTLLRAVRSTPPAVAAHGSTPPSLSKRHPI